MNTPLHKPAESSFIVPLSAELTPEDTNIRIFVSAGFFLLYRSRFPGKQQSLGNTQFNSLVISNPREKIPAPGMRRFHNFPPLFQHPARIRQARNVSGISIQWLSRVSRVFPALRLLTGTFSSGFSIRACLTPPISRGCSRSPLHPANNAAHLDRELKELSRRHSRGRAAGRRNRGVAMPSSGTDPCAPCHESPKNGL